MKKIPSVFVTTALILVVTVNCSYTDCAQWQADSGTTFTDTGSHTIESFHNYCDNLNISQHYAWTDSTVYAIEITFDGQSQTENGPDTLTFNYTDFTGVARTKQFKGTEFTSFVIGATEFDLTFHSDGSVTYWGYSFSAAPHTVSCDDFTNNTGTTFSGIDTHTIESAHSYCANMNVAQHYSWTDSTVYGIQITFDATSDLESNEDFLSLNYTDFTGIARIRRFTGTAFTNFVIDTTSFVLQFTSDASVQAWGYRFTAAPYVLSCTDFSSLTGDTFSDTEPHTIESSHQYCDNMDVTQHYTWTDSTVYSLQITFDTLSESENGPDTLTFSYTDFTGVARTKQFKGTEFTNFVLDATEFDLTFHTDGSVTYWGYRFAASPYVQSCADFTSDTGATFSGTDSHTIESPHSYCDNGDVAQHYSWTDTSVYSIQITFDTLSELEANNDVLTITYTDFTGTVRVQQFTGTNFRDFVVDTTAFDLQFTSDTSVQDWGYRFTAAPYAPTCTDFSANTGATFSDAMPHTLESSHQYCDNMDVPQHYSWTDSSVYSLQITFDTLSETENGPDTLTFDYTDFTGVARTKQFKGTEFTDFVLDATEFNLTFHTDGSVTYWGYRFSASPYVQSCDDFTSDTGATFADTGVHTIESPHQYCENADVSQHYSWTDSTVYSIQITFDEESNLEVNSDFLTISYTDFTGTARSKQFTGGSWGEFVLDATEFDVQFTSNGSVEYWGYRFTAAPYAPSCTDFSSSTGSNFSDSDVRSIESSHPYCDSMDVTQHYSWVDAQVNSLQITFDSLSQTENGPDYLTFTYTDSTGTSQSQQFKGTEFTDFTLDAPEFDLNYHTDGSVTYWGYRFLVTPHSVACDNFAGSTGETFTDITVQTIESPHDYCNNLNVSQHYAFTNSEVINISITFDDSTYMEYNRDFLTFNYVDSTGSSVQKSFTGTSLEDFVIDATEFGLVFTSDGSGTYAGYKFEADPRPCANMIDDDGSVFYGTDLQTIESNHPYCNNLNISQHYSFESPDTSGLYLTFDSDSALEANSDTLTISFVVRSQTVSVTYTGSLLPWLPLPIPATEFDLEFITNGTTTAYGYKITVDPGACSAYKNDPGATFSSMDPQVIESPHNYCDNLLISQDYSWSSPLVNSVDLVFDQSTITEYFWDVLTITYPNSIGLPVSFSYSGTDFPEQLTIPGDNFNLRFRSDPTQNYYGYKFTATPSMGSATTTDLVVKKSAKTKLSPQTGGMKMLAIYKKWKQTIFSKKKNKSK